jgi:hypothetical protein
MPTRNVLHIYEVFVTERPHLSEMMSNLMRAHIERVWWAFAEWANGEEARARGRFVPWRTLNSLENTRLVYAAIIRDAIPRPGSPVDMRGCQGRLFPEPGPPRGPDGPLVVPPPFQGTCGGLRKPTRIGAYEGAKPYREGPEMPPAKTAWARLLEEDD